MSSTKLIYLENSDLLEHEAKVIDILKEDTNDIVILQETIFYPQGGGQPYDQGIMESPSGKFIVKEVRFVKGIVKHIGNFETGTFDKNQTVKCFVDKERRHLNNCMHSAGHLIDLAVQELKLNWIPGKGYHFPQGPYIEYEASLENLDKDKLKTNLENICNKFIQNGIQTKSVFMDKEKLKTICHFVPDYIPEDKPIRVVMFEDFCVPCGGTHVSNLSDIKGITIRKIKAKGPNVRVSYELKS